MELNNPHVDLNKPPGERLEFVFPRIWAAFLLLLIGVTFPLWLDVAEILGERAAMPSVSLLGPNVTLPAAIDLPVTLGLVIALGLIVIKSGRQRFAWWSVAALLAVAFIADHQRLQPWAYQSALYAILFAALPVGRMRTYLLLPAASVYVFSALGKLDFQFTHTVGLDFLTAIVSPFLDSFAQWDIDVRSRLAFLFPTMELVLGIGLVVPATRRYAAVGIVLMHATLIAILGPWSLGHSLGVLIWNVLLAVQAWLLFFRWNDSDRSKRQQTNRPTHTSPHLWAARIAVAIFLLAPLLERRGYWDHWLSWSLYSPHTSRVEIEIHRSSVDAVGPTAEIFLQPDHDGDGWRRLSIADWSLATRNVPIYPQARFQLSLAIQLAREADIQDGIRAQVKSVSDRWTGRREIIRLLGRDELEAHAKRYWLVW